jgi:hypothetical protein
MTPPRSSADKHQAIVDARHASNEASLYDEGTSGLLMKIIKEFVLARREWADIDDTLGAGSNDFLDPKRYALELHGGRIEILDPQDDWLIGGRMDLSRLKMMTFNRDVDRSGLLGVGAVAGEKCCAHKYQRSYDRFDTCERRSHIWLPLTSIE